MKMAIVFSIWDINLEIYRNSLSILRPTFFKILKEKGIENYEHFIIFNDAPKKYFPDIINLGFDWLLIIRPVSDFMEDKRLPNFLEDIDFDDTNNVHILTNASAKEIIKLIPANVIDF